MRTHARARARAGCAWLRTPVSARSPGPHRVPSSTLSLPPCAVVEWVLARKGAVETELEDDPREARASRPAGYGAGRGGGGGGGGAGGRGRGGDDDDDEEDEEEEGSAGGRRR